MNLVRGYWEAKDTADKLEAKIEKNRKAGYALNNIIFEDTATASSSRSSLSCRHSPRRSSQPRRGRGTRHALSVGSLVTVVAALA